MSETKGYAISLDDRRASTLLRAVLDALPDEILLLSPNRQIIMANARVRERLGDVDPAIRRLSCYEVHRMNPAPCDPDCRTCLVEAVIRSGTPVQCEHLTVDNFGTVAAMEAFGVPLSDEAGVVQWVVQILRDPNRPPSKMPRRPSEAPTRRSSEIPIPVISSTEGNYRKAEATRNIQTLGALTEEVAHKMSNLMVGVISNTDFLLETTPLDSPIREILLDIADSSQQAVSLTRQISAYAGKHSVVPVSVRLVDVVESAARVVEASLPEQISLRLETDDVLPPIKGDSIQLRHALLNLITNAADALGQTPGVIEIRTGTMKCDAAYLAEAHPNETLAAGKYVYVEVSDTGCGMTPGQMQQIFDPFFSSKSLSRGLGLAAVLGIARNARGAVEVFSEPDQGSTFRLIFPELTENPKPRVPATITIAEPAPKAQTAATVLVVDDEQVIRNVAEQMLSSMGYTVRTAKDAAEAQSVLRDSPSIALTLLDFSMPGMDGEQCFKELRKINPSLKGILSSGHAEQELMPRFEESGLSGYIQKPYRIEQLQTILEQALQSKPR